jgi:hypothetical protein
LASTAGALMQTTSGSNLDEEFEQVSAQCWVALIEPASTKRTGDTEYDVTKSIKRQLAHLAAAKQQTREQET